MFVRLIVGAGLFALGYFVGKEMGRAESIRDQLSWAAEEEDLMSAKQDRAAQPESGGSESVVAARGGR